MNDVVLTFDMDWATDQQIEYVLDKTSQNKIKSTWFVTHQSKILERMKNDENIELAIHPNFHQNSTQGSDYEEVIQHLLKIIPDAKSVRTHSLFWSSRLMPLYKKYGIQNDASIMLFNTPQILPHKIKYFNLTRFPTYWEDDVAMIENMDLIPMSQEGLKIISFHPVHIFLNSYDFNTYKELKEPNQIIYGIDRIFDKFLTDAKKNNWCKHTIAQLGEKYESEI